jgi:TonB-dependent SusC/RagA subfamily outer membrane receptor
VGSAIGRIRADSLTVTAPITNLAETLAGRVAGVSVQAFGGTSTGRTEVRVRGPSSPSRSNAPLVYIDGVRVNMDAGSMSISTNGETPSRFNDLSPNEIASIDVLKGPSASTLYGTEAANGVLVITTKSGRGASKKAEWRAWTEQGWITEPNEWPPNYRAVDAAGQTCLLTSVAAGTCTQAEIQTFNLLKNPATTPFKTGHRTVLGLSNAGKSGDFSHYVSGEFEAKKGVLYDDGINKVNLRANFDVTPVSALDILVNAGYVSSDMLFLSEGSTALGPISNGLRGGVTADSWEQFSPQQLSQLDQSQHVERFIGSATLRLRPTHWLQLRAISGLDNTHREDEQLIPPNLLTGARAAGIRTNGWQQSMVYTNEFLARADFSLTDVMTSRTSAGAQYFKQLRRDLLTEGTGLVPRTNSIATAAQVVTVEGTIDSRLMGFFADQQFGYKDRSFLSVGFRSDNSSSFGGDLGYVIYPKISASWVISEEDFFPKSPALSSLRLRAAWGQSGRAPGATDAIPYYKGFSATVPPGTNVVSVSYDGGNLGNPKLKPELSNEVEGGFEAGFLKERITLSLGAYNRSTSDALVLRALAPSAGASPGRWENLAEIENRGVEAAVDALVFETNKVRLNLNATVANNTNKAIDLGEGVARIPLLVQEGLSGSQFHVAGYPLGGYWSRTINTYADANNDGIIGINEVTVTDTAQYMGAPTAPFLANIQPSMTLFERFGLSALFEIKRGNKLSNGTESGRCGRGNARARNDPTSSLWEQARCVASTIGGGGAFIERADWTKFRELSLSYTVPKSFLGQRLQAATVVVAGRNLGTWTPYTGVDPDVSSRRFRLVENDFQQSDGFQPAPVRTWVVRVNATF